MLGTLKLSQNSYREFRLDPELIPYRSIFMDHIGPFYVYNNGNKVKIWLLCITCMYTRAINLKICRDLSLNVFLKCFQVHCFEYGLPVYCITDLGSQLVAASNVITDLLRDPASREYVAERNVKCLQFEQYYKGCNMLGGMVESCVKLTKRLIFGAVRNNVLELEDFQFLISQTIHLVNRRPVAFKEALRDCSPETNIDVITPEILIHGHELLSLNVIPDLSSDPDPDPDWQNSDPLKYIKNGYQKLKSVREKLFDLYHGEYLANLSLHATNVPDRYLPTKHRLVKKGDIVLVKDRLLKPDGYPMCLVLECEVNNIGEVTGLILKKGASGEIIKRHSSCVIPLLSVVGENSNDDSSEVIGRNNRPRRQAAEACVARNRLLLS